MIGNLFSHGTLLRVVAALGVGLVLLGLKLVRDKAARKGWGGGTGEVRRMAPKDYALGAVLAAAGVLIAAAALAQPATWVTPLTPAQPAVDAR